MKTGIQTRLLFTTTLVLGTCLGVGGYILDRSFQASVLAGAQEQLRLVTYSLMGAVDVQNDQVMLREEPPEPRLSQPESGLYAQVWTGREAGSWRSTSALTTDVAFPAQVRAEAPGEFRFTQANGTRPGTYYLSYAVMWGAEDGAVLTFTVATAATEFEAAMRGFRRNLSLGAVVVAVLFIAAQFAALRWGLSPLRQMAEEVRELERGERQRLSVGYPTELARLAQNLDAFVEHEARSRTRYSNALENLAHSLKTPLAVIRNALGGQQDGQRELLTEQLQRMESTVHHQLSRASARGPVVVGGVVPLQTLITRLLRALQTAYTDRHLSVESDVDEDLKVRGDERDLMEILGNVLENAFKYTSSWVAVSAQAKDGGVQIVVDDDGGGIPEALRNEVRNRGTRADEVQQGQGIGLSVAAELVNLYQGTLDIDESPRGGARLCVWLRS